MQSNFSELFDRAGRLNSLQMRSGMPGAVQSYDPINQIVTVVIVQPEVTDDGEVLKAPVITDVPVLWPGGGGALMTFPLKAGDQGWLSFADRDISAWVDSRQVGVTPDSDRLHSITDAVFMPNFSRLASNPENVTVQFNQASIVIAPSGQITLTGAGVVVAAPLTVTGAVTFESTDINLGGIDFLTHVHGGVQSGGANTGGPTN